MKYLTVLLAFMLPTVALSADFTISINQPKVLTVLTGVCQNLRIELGNPTPWNGDICVKHLVIRGIKREYLESETQQAKREYRQRIETAKTAGEEDPVPTPTTTPTTTPSATPVP